MKNYLKLDKFIRLIILIITFTLMLTTIAFANGRVYPKLPEAWRELMVERRYIIAGISAFGALTSVLVFIYHMIQLASMPSHPIMRRRTITGILTSLICTALLGGVTLVSTLLFEIIFFTH
ncbi:MAG: hypothetical protein K0R54_39 [Clostridiaceae bacterium]|jgi:hypothetical protein|nr:hypothetical protein [Clostridiaceae bacterium]